MIVEYIQEMTRQKGISSTMALDMLHNRVRGRMGELEAVLRKGQDLFVHIKRRE